MQSATVQIDPKASQLIGDFFKGRSFTQLGVLVDPNTKRYCYSIVSDILPPHLLMEVAAGEDFKNLDTCQLIWERLTDLNFDRHALLLIIGGGVLGDMGGFCAATYKRGIDFVLVPTTLLAQVDASVGGKLGIDFKHFKNHIGVFKEPVATLISSSFLKTLPERELRSGFAEIIKHCLIADKAMWQIITQKKLLEQNWELLIAHSLKIKQHITDQDPNEKGLRKILNFGHTMGHALETYYLSIGKRIFHGEAVAMGMIMESRIANQKGFLTELELNAIQKYLVGVFGKIGESFDSEIVWDLARQDKKNKSSEVLMAIPKGIGQCSWDVATTRQEVLDALDYYRQL